MSEENVAWVRRSFQLLDDGDLDEMVRITPEDFVLDRSESRGLRSGVFRGPEEIRKIWEDFMEAWADYEVYETEIIDAGDVVVRVGGIRGRGRSSGIEVQAEAATVWRFEGGGPVSASLYQTKAKALEAAGLSE
jgi:ketosteroid isomerase-like protein